MTGIREPNAQQLRAFALPGALVAMFGGLGLCWVLAAPDGPEALAVPSTVGVGAVVLLVGLGALPMVGPRPSVRAIGVTGGLWFVATLVSAWMRTADQVGESTTSVRVGDFVETLGAGAPELIVLVAAGLTVGLAGVQIAGRIDPPVQIFAILAAIGLLALSITGHPSTHALGPVLIGAHALAAGWWCGTPAAMVLTVRGRSGWAQTLPEFSARALWAAATVAATGVVAGLIELDGLGALVSSGYGRVLIAKAAGLLVLIGLGVRHRARWVPSVTRHRATEATSVRLAVGELLIMAVVLGLAVGLSTTAP
ncbi:CopD family protein [Gordonia sp. CPCC 206044]|uniref:copper resistance D family protein n=1 Tax=Gordonia sp. CPCC 206044 TaxID=3140793 RepID=UPI003AF3E1BD